MIIGGWIAAKFFKNSLRRVGMIKAFGLVVPNYEEIGIRKPYVGDLVWDKLKDNPDFEYIPVKYIRFKDTSGKVVTEKSVRDKTVYVIHSYYVRHDTHTEIACWIADELKRSGAKTINLFDLYNKSFRQDKRKERESLNAKWIADKYSLAGIDRVFTFDPHSDQVQLAFKKCPLEELHLSQELADYFVKNYDVKNCTVCSPDFGAYGRAQRTANLLGLPLIILRKVREAADKSGIAIIGNITKYVTNRNIIIRDDVCGTAGTLVEAADVLREKGAGKIYALISHVDLCKGNDEEMQKAKQRIVKNNIKVVGTNTVSPDFTEDERRYFDIVDISPLIAEIISIHSKGASISRFFEDRLHKNKNLKI